VSLRDDINHWRAQFRQGVEDVRGTSTSSSAHYSGSIGPARAAPAAVAPSWGQNYSGAWGPDNGGWTPQLPHSAPEPPQHPLFEHVVRLCEEQEAQIAALTAELQRVQAVRDSYQASGRKLLAEVKPLRVHCEAIEKIGWREMSKASHPDTAPPEQRAAREELFKLVSTIFGRN